MSDDVERLAEGWLDGARARLDRAELGAKVKSIGRVEEVEDGVALVSGLPDVGLDELLRFDGGQFGFAQTLERDRVGCVLLDDAEAVEAGDTVRGTGDVVRVPGRRGAARPRRRSARPAARRQRADRGRGASRSSAPAPAIIDRDLVTQPVQTGVLVIDALFALGRGQRELIIGDRAIGKTTIAIDTIINQTDQRHRLRLCRGRAEDLERAARHRRDPGARRAGALHLRGRRGGEHAGAAMDRAVRRLHHGGIFPRPRPACADRASTT